MKYVCKHTHRSSLPVFQNRSPLAVESCPVPNQPPFPPTTRILEVHQRAVIQQEQKHCWTNTHFIGIFSTVFFFFICIMNVTNLFCCCFCFYSECNRIWEAALTGIVRYCWTSELMLLGSIYTIYHNNRSRSFLLYCDVHSSEPDY